jgi:hypothetical protein
MCWFIQVLVYVELVLSQKITPKKFNMEYGNHDYNI